MVGKYRNIVGCFLLVGFLLLGVSLAYAADSLVVADFDTCSKPNKLGGNYGAWDKDPMDFTQTAMESIMRTVKHGDKGCSIQIYYDVDSPNPAYNGFWMELRNVDVSAYSKLSIWVKGDEERAYTKVFKLELKNTLGEVGKTYITGITGEWQEIIVPFVKFMGITDFSELKE
jgi:hypothetical protein